MINVNTGEFKWDEFSLVVHPELTLSEFLDSDIPVPDTDWSPAEEATQLYFVGNINGLHGYVGIFFYQGRLHRLAMQRVEQKELRKRAFMAWNNYKDFERRNAERAKWVPLIARLQEDHKIRNDQWLVEVIGKPPPYIFDWGHILSCRDERVDDNAVIYCRFKYSFLDHGFPDVISGLRAEAQSRERFEEVVKGLDKLDDNRRE